MKRRDLMKHLAAHGCKTLREGGRHTIVCDAFQHRTSSVPRHNEVNDFTARKICRDLGIPEVR